MGNNRNKKVGKERYYITNYIRVYFFESSLQRDATFLSCFFYYNYLASLYITRLLLDGGDCVNQPPHADRQGLCPHDEAVPRHSPQPEDVFALLVVPVLLHLVGIEELFLLLFLVGLVVVVGLLQEGRGLRVAQLVLHGDLGGPEGDLGGLGD